jgi:hypothetical protein
MELFLLLAFTHLDFFLFPTVFAGWPSPKLSRWKVSMRSQTLNSDTQQRIHQEASPARDVTNGD